MARAGQLRDLGGLAARIRDLIDGESDPRNLLVVFPLAAAFLEACARLNRALAFLRDLRRARATLDFLAAASVTDSSGDLAAKSF